MRKLPEFCLGVLAGILIFVLSDFAGRLISSVW